MSFMNEIHEANLPQLDATTVEAGSNGTGYYDGLTDIEGFNKQGLTKFTDEHGRRGVVIHSDVGTVGGFERYAPGCGHSVMVCNQPYPLNNLIPTGEVGERDLEWWVGMLHVDLPNRLQRLVGDIRQSVEEPLELA